MQQLRKKLNLLYLSLTILIGSPLAASDDGTLDQHIDDVFQAFAGSIKKEAKILDHITLKTKLKEEATKATIQAKYRKFTTVDEYVEYFKKRYTLLNEEEKKLDAEKILEETKNMTSLSEVNKYCAEYLKQKEKNLLGFNFEEEKFNKEVLKPFTEGKFKSATDVASARKALQEYIQEKSDEKTEKEMEVSINQEKKYIQNVRSLYTWYSDKQVLEQLEKDDIKVILYSSIDFIDLHSLRIDTLMSKGLSGGCKIKEFHKKTKECYIKKIKNMFKEHKDKAMNASSGIYNYIASLVGHAAKEHTVQELLDYLYDNNYSSRLREVTAPVNKKKSLLTIINLRMITCLYPT